MSDKKWENFSVNMSPEDLERYDKYNSSRSGTARLILRTWMDVVEDYGIDEDQEQIQLAVLNAYRNSIDKNIQAMKSQRDKLDDAIEEITESDENEVMFEIDFRLKRDIL